MKKENVLAIITVLALGLSFNLGGIVFAQYGGGVSVSNPPTATSIKINNIDAVTTSQNVTLTLSANGATQMTISNDSNLVGASWETYATSKAWTLTSGDGTKTVYASFRNSSGSFSSTVSDSIILGATAEIIKEVGSVTLIRLEGDPRVYVIHNGKKKHIKSIEEFNAAGYKWENVTVVAKTAFDAYPDEESSTGTIGITGGSPAIILIKAKGDFKVYVVENGKKRHIPSAESFNSAGYKWSDIKEVEKSEADSYVTEGSGATTGVILIKAKGDFKVYVVENGKKRHIQSAELFNSAGYKWSDIKEVSAGEADGYIDETSVSIIINTPWLRVRPQNNTNGKALGFVYEGEAYNILEELGGWYKIESKVGIGWVSGSYAKKQ